MTTRDHAPHGAPCWADLWTSDVEGSRSFYGELFGWESDDPSPEYGGYFTFSLDGVPIAGGMGDMGEMAADNSWKIYLAANDVAETVRRAEAEGAQILGPPQPVTDLGIQAILDDPAGARLGVWQALTFEGFTQLNEHGAPSWFELYTRDYSGSLAFYRSIFGWDVDTVGDTDEFRYATMRNPDGEGELAGVMDAGAFLPEGAPSHWSIYWEVEDVDATVSKVTALGGSVVMAATDTPYGWLAAVTDPSGAQFKLRRP